MIENFRIWIYISLMIEVFGGLFLLSHMLPLRNIKHRRSFTVCYFLCYSALLSAQDYWSVASKANAYPVFLAMHILLMFLYSVIFCEGKFVFKIFLPLVYVSIVTLSGFPVNLLHQFFPGGYFRGFKLASSLVLLAVTLFLLHFKLDTQTSYPFSYYIIMIVMPLLNMVEISALKQYFGIFPYVSLIGCFTLILELLIYFTVWQSTGAYAQNMKLQLIAQQQQFQAVHIAELRDIVTDYHQIRHDMKNHVVCMDRLLSQEKYENLKEYFYSLSKEIYALENQIETGNEIVNQVINIKYATARRLGIPMEIEAVLPQKLAIPDHLLCAVIFNLLDNAIEASEKIEEPAVFIKLHIVKSYLSVTVKNRIEPWQQESAINRRTTKEQPHLHGLGLRIVQETVQKYNGISSFETKDGEYTASIMLECV